MTRPEAKLAVRGVGGAGGGGSVGAFSRLARERLDRSRSSDGMSGIGMDIGSGNGRPLAGHPSTTCVVAGSSLRDWSFRADCGDNNAESDVAVAAAASFSGYPHHDRSVLEVDSDDDDDDDNDDNDKDDNDDALAATKMGEASVGESSRKALLPSADGVETSSAATEPSSTVPSDLTPHFVHLRVASDGSGAVLRHCVADASADAGPWRAWERGRRGAAAAAAAAGTWSDDDDDDHGSRGSRRRRHRHQQRQRKGLRFHASKIRLRAAAASNAATATNAALPGQWRHVSNLAASLAPKATASCAPPPAPAESSPHRHRHRHRHQPHQHQPTTDAKERHGRKWTSPDFLTSMPLWRNDSASDQTCARSRDGVGVGVGVDMDIQTNTNQDTKTPLRKNLRLVDLDESPPLYESPSSPIRVAVARVEHVARATSARKERERGNKRRRNGRRRNGAARGAGVAIVDLDNPPNDDNDDDDDDDSDNHDDDDENYNESITTDNNNTHGEKEKKKEEKDTDGDCSLSFTNRKKTVVAVVARAVDPRPTKSRRSPPRSNTLLGRKLTNSRGDKHVSNDIHSDNDDNKNDCDNDDDDDSDDDDNDGDVLVRNPFRDEALQSPSCTSPGTLRLTSDGLRRHERKTSLQSGETPLPPPPLSTQIQSSDMGVAGDSNFLIPIATMSPTEWKRRRDVQRMMLLSDREQLQQQQQQQQEGFRLRGGDGANNASADVGACIAMTKLRSGEDKATTTITTTTTTTTAAAAVTSISPPLKPIPMPLDERSGASTTTTDDAGSDDGGTLRKIRKGVKKQLEALVARAGSDASLSNMYAGRGDDASTSAQSRLSTMACAPDDFSPCGDGGGGGGGSGNGSGGGGGGGDKDKDESRNDDVAPLWKLDLNFPHRIKAATKKGIKKKTSDRSPKWFERQIIREEDAEEGFAQVSGSGLSAEWIGGCSQRQTAGQQEEMPRWMMLGMRTGETTAEAGVGVATFANEGVRAGANRRGARRPNLRDTWGKGDCILGSSTITFNSVGPNDSGVEVANCLGAKGGDCNVVGNRSNNDCDDDDNDDDDDGQKSCSVFSVATARADNRRAVRLPNSPAVPGLCMPTGSHPPALSLPPSLSLSSSAAAAAAEKATEPTVPGRCAVCDEGPRTHVAVPCMHLSFCAECVSELRAGGEKSCPVCGEDDVTFSKVNF